MAPSARTAQDREEQASLLPNANDDQDEGDLAPVSKQRQRTDSWKRVAIYTALVLLGVLVGSLISQGIRTAQNPGKKQKGDDGPRVPPIYKLPPVSSLPISQDCTLTSSQVVCPETRLILLKQNTAPWLRKTLHVPNSAYPFSGIKTVQQSTQP